MKIEMDGFEVFWCVVALGFAVVMTAIVITGNSVPGQTPECKNPKVIGKLSGKNTDLYRCEDGRTIEIDRKAVKP